jgi:hypothetical protein
MRTITGFWQQATIPSTDPVVIAMNGAPLPCAITLKSAAAGRLIELSTDGGVEYFNAALDVSTATMQIVTLQAPATHVRITGTAADTWSIL